MANPTTYFGWVMPNSADLVTDLPADFNVFGQGVDTSMQFLLGGTTGQVLSKTSATNMAFTWINNDQGDITGVTAGTGISGGGTSGAVTITNDMATTITASGDIVVGTGSGTYDNLPIGTTAQVLTADTTVSPYKVKWATPASSSPLTTKGDLFTYSTTDARLPIGGDYGFLQALASETTGNKWNDSAWTTYTPTLTASTGTATTTSVTGRYIRIGKMCVVENDIYITNKGTAAGNMMVTLPFTARANAYVGSAMENSVIGVVCRCYVAPSENKINLCQYDGVSLLWVNGYGIYSTIAFEVA